MATRLEVIISGDSSKLIQSLRQAGAQVKTFSDEGDKAGKSAKGLGVSVTDLAASFGIATTIEASVVALVNFTKESFVAAAQSERLGKANEAMASTIGESSDSMIDAIQKASNHTISRMDAMQASNKAMMFGLVQSADEMAELTQGAIVLGNAMGQDATKSLDDLTTALGRQSPLILDNLGITLKLEDAHRIYAESVGKTVEQLTAEEKQRAFVSAALIKMREKVEELGGVQLDAAGKMEQFNARWEDAKVSIGGALISVEESLGLLENLGNVVTSAGEAFEVGLLPGLAQLALYASNPLAPLEALGFDVIPEITKATGGMNEATQEANETSAAAAYVQEQQAKAHSATTAEIETQAEASEALAEVTRDGLVKMGELTEKYNEKIADLQQDRLDAMSSEAEARTENTQKLNERLRELEEERAEKIRELSERGTEVTGQEYNKQLEKINQHYAKSVEKTQESYQEENEEIKNKLDERLEAIKEQQAEEERLYKEKAEELKRLISAQALEQSGKLEEMTGIAGITAQQYVDAVKYGAIQANKEVESEMAGIEKQFEGSQKKTSALVAQNQEIIKRAHGESLSSIRQAHDTQTSHAISNWESQRRAAENAVPPLFRPGSPTPFEIGLRGIADAANSVTRSFDSLAPSLAKAQAAGTFVVGAQASASELERAREAKKAWYNTAAGEAYKKKIGFGQSKAIQPSQQRRGRLVQFEDGSSKWMTPEQEASYFSDAPGAATGGGKRPAGVPPGWKLDETGLGWVPPEYQPGYVWDGSKWVPPGGNTTNNYNLTVNSALPSAGLQQDFQLMKSVA